MATRLHIAAVGTTADPDASSTLTALERFSATVLDPAVNVIGGRFVGEGMIEIPDDKVEPLQADLAARAEESLSPLGIEIEISNGDGAGGSGHWRRALVALPLGGVGFAAMATIRARGGDEALLVEEEVAIADPVEPAETPQENDFLLPDGEPDTLFDGLAVYATDPGHVDIVQASVERMAAYGFELPTDRITVVFDPTGESCDGNTAYAAHGADADDESYLVVCHDTMSTVIHELSHIWAGKNLTEDDHQAWVDERGLDAWSSSDADSWREAGTEHFAEIVAWGLDDDFKRVMVSGGHDVDGINDSFQYVLENLAGASPREAWYTMTEEEHLALVPSDEGPVAEDTTLLLAEPELVVYELEDLSEEPLAALDDLGDEDVSAIDPEPDADLVFD